GDERGAVEVLVVADEVGVLGEVVLEQVQQDVQDAFFHFLGLRRGRGGRRDAHGRVVLNRCGTSGRAGPPRVLPVPAKAAWTTPPRRSIRCARPVHPGCPGRAPAHATPDPEGRPPGR